MNYDNLSDQEKRINDILLQTDIKVKFYQNQMSNLLSDKGPEPRLAPPGSTPSRPTGTKNRDNERLEDLIRETKKSAYKQISEIYKAADLKTQQTIRDKTRAKIYPEDAIPALDKQDEFKPNDSFKSQQFYTPVLNYDLKNNDVEKSNNESKLAEFKENAKDITEPPFDPRGDSYSREENEPERD